MTLWLFILIKQVLTYLPRERLLLQIFAASDKINKLLFVFCFALNVIFTAYTLKFLVYLSALLLSASCIMARAY